MRDYLLVNKMVGSITIVSYVCKYITLKHQLHCFKASTIIISAKNSITGQNRGSIAKGC